MSDPCYEDWFQHRVSYGETDAMRVAYHGEYLHFFERARNSLIRSCGVSYNLVEERGVFMPVREVRARYKHPLRFDDLINIRTIISEWGRASVTFKYEIYNEDKTCIHATGMTQHAFVNGAGRPVRTPTWLKDLFTIQN